MTKLIPAAGAAALSVAVLAAPAFAHHSFAMFERGHHMMIEGTVSEWHFNSPHTWLYVSAPDENGEMQNWGFEGGAPVHAIRMGVNGQTFRYGEPVKVIMAPLRDGRPAGAACFVVKEDGSVASFNDGGCMAGPVRARWEANGWIENGANLDAHPVEDAEAETASAE